MVDWQEGQILQDGKYTIIKKLRKGGFGATFLARDNQNKFVVIKTLNEEIQQEPYFDKIRQDFYNEALRIAQCKNDDNDRIVKIYKVIEEDQLPCIVMEYIPGEDLATKVHEKGTLSETEALTYIRQIGEALIKVHKQGFLHRDIKPQNIIVRSDGGGAVLIDFGTAREFNLNETFTTRTAFSSGGYTPVEQYNSRAKQGPYTDVYALAGTLYFLLTKQIPPNAVNRNTSLNPSAPDPLKPLKTIAPHVSDRINFAVMKGLSFHSQERPQTVEEFLKLLLPDYQMKEPETFLIDGHPLDRDRQSKKSLNKSVLLGFSGLLSIIILGIIYFILLSPKESQFTNIELFEPQKGKIKIQYPNDWKIEREPITNELGKFISPLENDTDNFQETLIISVELSDLSLDEYTAKTIKQINKNITNNVIDSKTITLDNKEATQVIYQQQFKGKILKTMQIWTLINNRVYIVTYMAEENKYNQFKPTIEKMIDSLEID